MSDIQLEVKVNRLVIQSGFNKSKEMLSPIIKIIKMRHKDISSDQALRVVKSILK